MFWLILFFYGALALKQVLAQRKVEGYRDEERACLDLLCVIIWKAAPCLVTLMTAPAKTDGSIICLEVMGKKKILP